MEISFSSSKMEKTFNSGVLLQRTYGQQTKLIIARMAVLRAAQTLADVPGEKPERCHPLKQDRGGCYAVDLKHPFRLVFEPTDQPVPRLEDGNVDLQSIKSIRILEVVDYH